MKSAVFSVRLTQKEIENFEKMAVAIGVSKRDFFRFLISTSGSAGGAESNEKTSGKIERLEAEISRLRLAISELVTVLGEQRRTPSFFEFRARRLSEGNTSAPADYTPTNALRWQLGLAVEYFARYAVWPSPTDGPHRFGQLPSSACQHWPSRQIAQADIESIVIQFNKNTVQYRTPEPCN